MSLGDFCAVLGLVFTALGGVFVVCHLVLKAYHKKEADLAKSKHEYRTQELTAINEKITELKTITKEHEGKISSFTVALEKSYMRYNAQAESLKILADNFKSSMHELRDDMKGMRSQVVQVTNDLMIIKARRGSTS